MKPVGRVLFHKSYAFYRVCIARDQTDTWKESPSEQKLQMVWIASKSVTVKEESNCSWIDGNRKKQCMAAVYCVIWSRDINSFKNLLRKGEFISVAN